MCVYVTVSGNLKRQTVECGLCLDLVQFLLKTAEPQSSPTCQSIISYNTEGEDMFTILGSCQSNCQVPKAPMLLPWLPEEAL